MPVYILVYIHSMHSNSMSMAMGGLASDSYSGYSNGSFTGSGKAAILQKLLNEGPSEQLPASWLRQHGCVWLWVDRAAMG